MHQQMLKKVESAQLTDNEDDVSLFRGGLVYRAQVLAHLIDTERWNVSRRVVIVLVFTWLPLVIITALFDRDQLFSLLTDYQVYSRVAIAIPVLLIGQLVMEDRFSVVARHVRKAQLLSDDELRKLKDVLARIRRLRDSPLSELIILALIFVDLALVWKSRVASAPAWAVYQNGGVPQLRLAGWYYGSVVAPIYQLLLVLCLWKWLLWSFFLFRLSRMNLELVATHPDGHGGLGFLGLSPIGFVPVAAALSTVIGASWSSAIRDQGARLANFKFPAIILIVLMFLIALAPLALFVRKLDVLRRTAMLEYAVLAQRQANYLHGKWFSPAAPEETQLTVSEVSALADFALSYQNIRRLRPFPADKGTLISLALAVIAPLFPAVLAEFPLSVIVKGLLQAVKAVPM